MRFRDLFASMSKTKFLAWWLLTVVRPNVEVRLTLRDGRTIFLRNRDDYGVAYELFVNQIYAGVPLIEAPVIVDLGGHVGFATLFLARLFPHAQVIVMEPDHGRVLQIQKHVL